jgi:hypothetical protein
MVALVFAAVVSVALVVPQFGLPPQEPAPVTDFEFQTKYFGDGVAKNDSVVIKHAGGDRLKRERLEVVVDGVTVYNETSDSESTNPGFEVPGLVIEVDADEFNDLNKPCRVNGERVSPNGTCGGVPGDEDGSDPGVVLEWAQNVTAGQRLVIQERNHEKSYNVLEAGDTVKIIYHGDDFSAVIAEWTIDPESADST